MQIEAWITVISSGGDSQSEGKDLAVQHVQTGSHFTAFCRWRNHTIMTLVNEMNTLLSETVPWFMTTDSYFSLH